MGKSFRFDKRDNMGGNPHALSKRSGKVTPKERRQPRGGSRNDLREFLDNLPENEDDHSDIPVAAE